MSSWSFAQRILFAEDMITYFMKDHKLEWTPGTRGAIWDGHPRRFTEEMGYVALRFTLMETAAKDRSFDVKGTMGCFKNAYNHLDFLHYCGIIGRESARKLEDGVDAFADGAVIGIITYLEKTVEDGTFDKAGGWAGLEECAAKLADHMRSLRNPIRDP